MRFLAPLATGLAALLFAAGGAADTNLTNPQSQQILASTFTPPQVWKNVNLVRNINLLKGYPRETINLVIENVSPAPQQEYYLPFEGSVIARVGGLEVRDKNDATQPAFLVETVEYDTYSPTQYYSVRLPQPLQPSSQQTLSISFSLLSALQPLPATISQMEKQFVQHTFSAYFHSAYTTLKQKTKLKFPNAEVPDYTILPSSGLSENSQDPQVQGTTFTYGPFGELPAGASEPVSVRYEFTNPLNHVSLLERDFEISHWGGNLKTEEHYWLTNRAASLKNHFSRVEWQRQAYYNPPTSALKTLKVPLMIGSADAYFVDDIGNVSTSWFRTNLREANLELKPRYPLFGNWNYKFKVGWNQDLKSCLRKLRGGDGYVLRIPFLEGPQQAEGVEYERVRVKVILPEGATNVKFGTGIPLVSSETSMHRTFMDTLGRTSLTLTAINLVDDFRDRDLVITYDYPFSATFTKPLTIVIAVFGIFVTAWLVGRVDVSIGKKA